MGADEDGAGVGSVVGQRCGERAQVAGDGFADERGGVGMGGRAADAAEENGARGRVLERTDDQLG
jgi:hypothetical protein